MASAVEGAQPVAIDVPDIQRHTCARARQALKPWCSELTDVDVPLHGIYKRSQWSAGPTSCACRLAQQCPPSSVQDEVTPTAFLRLTCCGRKAGKLQLHVHVSSSAHTWPMLWQASRR